MRIGEAIALKWDDIDFVERVINVKRSYVRGRISTPKSGKKRPVDMSPQLAATLKGHPLSASEYVFTNEAGGLVDRIIGEGEFFTRR